MFIEHFDYTCTYGCRANAMLRLLRGCGSSHRAAIQQEYNIMIFVRSLGEQYIVQLKLN